VVSLGSRWSSRLDLLAQHLHPLGMAQHTQRDEVGHIQNTADAEALAYP
jgi:hypothetical protein